LRQIGVVKTAAILGRAQRSFRIRGNFLDANKAMLFNLNNPCGTAHLANEG
jgi:hypothetical protein